MSDYIPDDVLDAWMDTLVDFEGHAGARCNAAAATTGAGMSIGLDTIGPANNLEACGSACCSASAGNMQAESQLDAQIHALAPPCDTPPVASSQLDDAGNSEEGTASTQGSKPKKDLALSCHFTQCDYDGTFPSRWELGRHIRSKHTRSKTFTCPYPGCLRGLHVPTFARPDKLTSHIRDCHVNRSSDALLDCPASNCSFLPDTLCNLGNHIRLRHFLQSTNANKQRELCGDGVEVLRAVANASSSVPRKEKSNGTD